MNIAAIIMASGFSRRMNENKLFIEYKGKTLVEYVLDAVKAQHMYYSVVVTAYDQVRQMALLRGMDVVMNDRPDLGQSQSVILGTQRVRQLPKAPDGVMFFPGDMPFLNYKTLRQIVDAFEKHPQCIIRPRYAAFKALQPSGGSYIPGNPVIFPADLMDELCSVTGDSGGRTVIKQHPQRIYFEDIADGRSGIDIDSPEDVCEWL